MFILNPYKMEKHCNESFGAALVYVRKQFKVVHVGFYTFVYIIAVFLWLI